MIGERDAEIRPARVKNPQICAIFSVWHGLCNWMDVAEEWIPGWFGRLEMTFNYANLPQILVSLVGAVVTATVFVSAAVGPVAQFV